MSRLLPSLNALRAFEASARLKSLTRAAEEMNVTQAAISRQVRTLEDYLQVSLFVRGHRSVELTPAGNQLFSSITSAFSEIEHGVSAVSRRGRRRTLSIRTYTTFAQRWLIPRLARFHERFPSVEVFLSASTSPIDFDRDHIDAAIRYGREEDFRHVEHDFVAPYQITPVCRTSADGAIENDPAVFLRDATLLHSIARLNNWEIWLKSLNIDGIDAKKGLRFESSSMAYDAAIQGIGVAMGTTCLIADDLKARRLIAPFAHVRHEESFYLIYKKTSFHSAALRSFRDWIREEVQADSAYEPPTATPMMAMTES